MASPIRGSTASAGTGTVTLTVPAGTVSGDGLVVFLFASSHTAPTAPGGWTLNQSIAFSSSGFLYGYSRTVGVGDPSSYTWTLVGTSLVGRCVALVQASVPEAGSTAGSTGGGMSVGPVTTLGPNRAVLTAYYFGPSNSDTPAAPQNSLGVYLGLDATWVYQAPAGSTGAMTASLGSSGPWAAIEMAAPSGTLAANLPPVETVLGRTRRASPRIVRLGPPTLPPRPAVAGFLVRYALVREVRSHSRTLLRVAPPVPPGTPARRVPGGVPRPLVVPPGRESLPGSALCPKPPAPWTAPPQPPVAGGLPTLLLLRHPRPARIRPLRVAPPVPPGVVAPRVAGGVPRFALLSHRSPAKRGALTATPARPNASPSSRVAGGVPRLVTVSHRSSSPRGARLFAPPGQKGSGKTLSWPILFTRGPITSLPAGIPEGAPFEAGIVVGGVVYELLYLGGHDGQDKLVGGGFQTIAGPPSFVAPAGTTLFDTTNRYLWVSHGDGTWSAFAHL